MRRILFTTFISCSHGEIRFLHSKKNKNRKRIENNRGIDYCNRIPSIPEPGIGIGLHSKKCWNLTALYSYLVTNDYEGYFQCGNCQIGRVSAQLSGFEFDCAGGQNLGWFLVSLAVFKTYKLYRLIG